MRAYTPAAIRKRLEAMEQRMMAKRQARVTLRYNVKTPRGVAMTPPAASSGSTSAIIMETSEALSPVGAADGR